MELIKQIKEAEARSKEMVASAQRQAALLTESSAMRREEAFAKAKARRKETIAAAVAQAEKEAASQAQQYDQQARQQREDLKAKARSKMVDAAGEVLKHFRGI